MKGHVTTIIRKPTGQPRITAEGREDRGGYFFIRDEAEQDRFAHARDLRGSRFEELRENDPVEFEPITRTGGKGNGLAAEQIKVIK